MWMFVVTVALLGRNQAFPGNSSSFLLILQQQQAQATASSVPGVAQQQTSSSSSSSSDTSESSQSSESLQQLRERQNLENMAVEQKDSSQESTEVLQAPGTRTTSLWLHELVALGQKDETHDSGETGRHRASPQSKETDPDPKDNGSRESVPAGGRAAPPAAADGDAGDRVGHDEDGQQFVQLADDSTEKADGLTFDLLGYHGNEAGLELGL